MIRLQACAVGRRPVAIAWLAPARVGQSRVVSSSRSSAPSSNATSHGSWRRRSIVRMSWNDSAIAASASSPT